MNTNTESYVSSEKAQSVTNFHALHGNTQCESSSDQPEAQDTGVQDLHDADNDLVSSPPLPASKARCIALVVTVTGATFLNVNPHQLLLGLSPLLDMDYRHLLFNQLSLYFRLLQKISIYPRAECNG